MPQDHKMPEGQVKDAVRGNWVDHKAPLALRPYLRLSRADRPIGFWLLFIPCVWGIALAIIHSDSASLRDLWLLVGCGAGAWLMRGAGCTWNDIADRHYDAQVERTRTRPLPSRQISVTQAVLWMLLQTLLAAFILLSFGWFSFLLGASSLLLVALYPFAKRVTWWPQLVLGLTFNWGALLGWAAHSGTLENISAIYLYLGGVAWTLFYDTIYAHQDTKDDAVLGIKSTARLLRAHTSRWLMGFIALCFIFLTLAIFSTHATPMAKLIALGGVLGMVAHLMWQLRRFDPQNNDILLVLFRSNQNAGLIACFFLLMAGIV